MFGKLFGDLIDYGEGDNLFSDPGAIGPCRHIVQRLIQVSPVSELDALAPVANERDFEPVAKAVRDAIEKNEPEAGLDRLHTFVVKFVRRLCEQRGGIAVDRDKPLHSLLGEYVKRLRANGHIDSEMTARILKSSIGNLEAFNDVDNQVCTRQPLLSYDEALLIFNNVASSIRFLRTLEKRLARQETATPPTLEPIDDNGLSPYFRCDQHVVGDGLDGGADRQEGSEGGLFAGRVGDHEPMRLV